MFSTGGKVVYLIHGAGVTEGIEKKKVLGEVQGCYILKMPTSHMSVMVPIKQTKKLGVREVLSKEKMGQAFKTFTQEDESKLPRNWNRRYCYNMDRIRSGDIEEVTEVVLCLEILDHEESLPTEGREMLDNTKQVTISEMILIYGRDEEEPSNLVDYAILSSQ